MINGNALKKSIRRRASAFALLLFAFCTGCSTLSLNQHEVLKESFWGEECRGVGTQKVKAAPPALIDYMARFAQKYGYPGNPKAIESFDEEKLAQRSLST